MGNFPIKTNGECKPVLLNESIDRSIREIGYRGQSDFVNRYLTLGRKNTDIGKRAQALCEIESIRMAVYENTYRLRWSQWKLGLLKLFSPLLYLIGLGFVIKHKEDGIEIAKRYLMGAKKNYDFFSSESGNLTEKDTVKNDAEENIKTMFHQALHTALERGGIPDSGDLEYAAGLKISESDVIYEIQEFAFLDGHLKRFTNQEKREWLDNMFERYKHGVC